MIIYTNKKMEKFKKILMFIVLILSIIGGIGSLGYLIWLKAYVVAAGEAAVIGFAVPTWIKTFKEFLG